LAKSNIKKITKFSKNSKAYIFWWRGVVTPQQAPASLKKSLKVRTSSQS